MPDGPAINNPETRAAFRKFLGRSLGLVGAGLVAWVVAVVVLAIANYPDNGPVSDVVVLLMGFGLVPLIGGVLALFNALRAYDMCFTRIRGPSGLPTYGPGASQTSTSATTTRF